MIQTVYVGLSGGVDSSVTAALLQERGFRVVGVYMKNWTKDIGGVECPWKADLADARAVAAKLKIPFKVFDFQTEYKQMVVNYMVAEYAAGRTPNPDVMCNQEIKFKLFLNMALADGADLIATGHYARVEDGKLYAGVDAAKDQSYFLYRVTESALKRTIMPIGKLTKPETRQLAGQYGLITASKPDSQGICFVGEVGIRPFLKEHLELVPGSVIDKQGQIIGRHEGAALYTIGQRHGLGIGGGRPFYVIGKNVLRNEVFVTDNPSDLELASTTFELKDAHWINAEPDPTKTYKVRSRYRAKLINSRITRVDGGYKVEMKEAERAVSPGQSAVIYDDDKVLGGGIIRTNIPAVIS